MSLPQSMVKALLFTLMVFLGLGAGGSCLAQDGTPRSYVVILPDPTPRQPDLDKVYNKQPATEAARVQQQRLLNQIRMREVWLEVNQLVLLAQQLQQTASKPRDRDALAMSAAKAGEIQKLAKSMKEKLREH
ncbi:MAG: hypothetical protein KGK08_08980 [Acidobacteriota bacterium]|nr:hypothetical protein [Acidobacteriota bacterium]